MTTQELIALLQQEDQNAVVGAAFTDVNGYVNTFVGIKHATDGTVILDMDENTLSPDELDIQPRRPAG